MRPALRSLGIRILDQAEYPPGAADCREAYFRREIAPVLTMLAFDPGRGDTFVFLEDVICANAQHLFSGTQVRGSTYSG